MTHLAALAGIISVSFSAIFMQLASASPATAAFWRAAYGLPFLVVGWLMIRTRDHRDTRSRLLAFTAGLILALDLVVWQMAIDRIGAGLAVVLAAVQVVIVGALAWVFYKERPTVTALAVVPVILLGVTMISGVGRSDSYGSDPVLGTVFGLATAFTYAGFLLAFRHSNRAHLAPAPGPMVDATIGVAVGGMIAGLLDPGFTLAFSWPTHGWFLCLGLIVQVFGWSMITIALPRLPALETSVLLVLQPMLALIWARLIFTENLSSLQWIGVAVVLGGVLTLAIRGTVVPRVTPPLEAAARDS